MNQKSTFCSPLLSGQQLRMDNWSRKTSGRPASLYCFTVKLYGLIVILSFTFLVSQSLASALKLSQKSFSSFGGHGGGHDNLYDLNDASNHDALSAPLSGHLLQPESQSKPSSSLSSSSSSSSSFGSLQLSRQQVEESVVNMNNMNINSNNNNEYEKDSKFHLAYEDYAYKEPYFDESVMQNVTAPLGATTFLLCRILHLGDRTVSWVRQKDLHILTSGSYIYTSDQRFRSIHLPQSNDWTLEVRDTQTNDSGVYECQISTETKLSASVYLEIIDVRTEILEGKEAYVQKGAFINLTCVINFIQRQGGPAVFWYHNNELINYDSKKRGVKVRTEIKSKETVSNLIIQDARSSDSGNYSCKLASYGNTSPASISVQVLNGGENPAAMQHGKGQDRSTAGITNKSNKCSLQVTTQDKLLHGLLTILIIALVSGNQILWRNQR